MNGVEVLRIVDAIHRDKNVDKEIIFEGIEQALLSAARKHYGEEADIGVTIHRETGEVAAHLNGEEIPPDELGRIAAQTAKQVMIQKIREAERDSLYDEFEDLRTQLVTGTITRLDHGIATVNLGKVEALLPRSEQIPGESHRVGERVRCVVIDVRKQGSRVKIILSRTHPELVRRLFEVEIPEVNERIIEVRSLAREAGYRSKVAVTCYDTSIDAVGACVGVRGSRIKNIVDELAGERIDIVRWNDSLQVLIPNALQPAEVEDVILCPMLGRVIVLVRDDQLSLAIGKKGQNVRLASKLVGWDIEVMTREELDEQLERSVAAFATVPHVSEELAEALVSQGFFSYEDLSVIEPDQLLELSGLTPQECEEIVAYADTESEREEREADARRALERAEREAARLAEEAEAAAQAAAPPERPAAAADEAHGPPAESAEAGIEQGERVTVGIDVEEPAAEQADSDAAGTAPAETTPSEVAVAATGEGGDEPAGDGPTDETDEMETFAPQEGEASPEGEKESESESERQSAVAIADGSAGDESPGGSGGTSGDVTAATERAAGETQEEIAPADALSDEQGDDLRSEVGRPVIPDAPPPDGDSPSTDGEGAHVDEPHVRAEGSERKQPAAQGAEPG